MSDLNISFEFFPPKTEEVEARLWDSVKRLSPLQPKFVSVTYGAGGSTRERTLKVVSKIASETSNEVRAAGHITCVAASKSEVDDVLKGYWDNGVTSIVALRGDPVGGIGAAYEPHPDGYTYATDLIAGAKEIADFDISVGCYPESHPEARSVQNELNVLKNKIDAGADRAITQFFFEPETYLRYRDKAAAAGIDKPIVPGIMLQSNFGGLSRMSEMCGIYMPPKYADLYEGLEDDLETRDLVTAHLAADLCNKLRDEGVKDFHFYTMNRAGLSLATCRLLGVKPVAGVQ
jgi:methylenetetrahydrofolate reductase (NADPH)